jgi:pimeloyl-ACP methyl ester carboxylesterase
MLSTTVDMRAEVAKVRLRTLILHGDLDTSAPIDLTGRRTAELIPDATLSVYPGAGHGLFVSHYERLADDIAGFAAR